MSIAEKLTTIAENQERVFEAGKKSQYDEFWDRYQENGTRTNYQFAFGGRGWKKTNLKPKYDVKPVIAANMFAETDPIRWGSTQPDELIDLYELEQEQGIVFDFTNCTNIHSCFRYCAIKRINTINIANARDLTYIFFSALYLERIEHLILHGLNYWVGSRPFDGMNRITYIGFEGQIDGNNWNLSQCTKLEKQCLIAFMNCLVDKTTDTSGTNWAITFGATNLAKLTDTEKAIATEKGWTLA